MQIVTISDMKLSNSPGDVLATFSLGSCVGVAAFDPVARVGGLTHCLLPSPQAATSKNQGNPFVFVSTGVTEMVRRMFAMGARKSNLLVYAAGCASMYEDDVFLTGQRNLETLQRLLGKNKLRLQASDVGGAVPRTMFLRMETGKVTISSLGRERDL